MNYLLTSRNFLKAVALLVLSIAAHVSFAQLTRTEVAIVQRVFGMEKRLAVANFIPLGDAADRFWKVYDAYEAERKQLGAERIQIISDYASSYPDVSDEEIQALFKRTTALGASFDKLQKTYFRRMKKEVGASIAAQFWQLESYFHVMIQAEIYSQIPFIGEHMQDR